MYPTCLFCAGTLGRNDTIEHLPIGRRLAFDPDKGRLWVVCVRCARWNLTPLETRWEAIEEAERVFRATRLRASTDNIGLAQARDGLDLVRIGPAPRAEFSAWRYGDQFGRRYRRNLLIGGAVIAASTAPAILPLLGIGVIGSLVSIGASARHVLVARQRVRVVRAAIRGQGGEFLRLTERNMRQAVIVPHADHGWALSIPHRVEKVFGSKSTGAVTVADAPATSLTGPAAAEAMTRILPYLNHDGGSRSTVRKAVAVVEQVASVDDLITRAASDPAHGGQSVTVTVMRPDGGHTTQTVEGIAVLASLSAPVRLALEMSLHEDDERRAMDGELHRLEERWREAEEIAAIADAMLIPREVNEELESLRRREGAP